MYTAPGQNNFSKSDLLYSHYRRFYCLSVLEYFYLNLIGCLQLVQYHWYKSRSYSQYIIYYTGMILCILRLAFPLSLSLFSLSFFLLSLSLFDYCSNLQSRKLLCMQYIVCSDTSLHVFSCTSVCCGRVIMYLLLIASTSLQPTVCCPSTGTVCISSTVEYGPHMPTCKHLLMFTTSPLLLVSTITWTHFEA